MWDARTDPVSGEPAEIQEIGLELADATEASTDATLVLTPPQAFLTDPATVYPVTIDPTTTLYLWGDTFVHNRYGAQDGQTSLHVGSWNGGTDRARGLLNFDVSEAKNRVIQDAKLSLFNFYSASCSPRWVDIRPVTHDFEPSTATWANQPNIDFGRILANANVAYGYNSSCPARWVDFNLTQWVQLHSDRSKPYGDKLPLAVTAGSETDSLAWKKFHSEENGMAVPTLTYTYDGNCDQYDGHYVCGDIRAKWEALAEAGTWLGWPTSGADGHQRRVVQLVRARFDLLVALHRCARHHRRDPRPLGRAGLGELLPRLPDH